MTIGAEVSTHCAKIDGSDKARVKIDTSKKTRERDINLDCEAAEAAE